MANTAGWRAGSQRLAVWFGDAPSDTATTAQAQAIDALNAKGVTVIAFNSASSGIDEYGQASAVTSATGGTLTNQFTYGLDATVFAAAVNAQISLATSTLDLVFGTDHSGSGLSFAFACTDPLGCTLRRGCSSAADCWRWASWAEGAGRKTWPDVRSDGPLPLPRRFPGAGAVLSFGGPRRDELVARLVLSGPSRKPFRKADLASADGSPSANPYICRMVLPTSVA